MDEIDKLCFNFLYGPLNILESHPLQGVKCALSEWDGIQVYQT